MMGKNNSLTRKIVERIAIVETKLDDLITNDIPHLRKSISGIKQRVRSLEMTIWKAVGGIAVLYILFQLLLIWLKGGI
jgi:hypothetical protein